jgi:hypothetical protein
MAKKIKRGPRPVLSSPAPDGLARLKLAFGGWKDVDVERFKADIKASRKISTRPVVSLHEDAP